MADLGSFHMATVCIYLLHSLSLFALLPYLRDNLGH
jgi:hypothetical protein